MPTTKFPLIAQISINFFSRGLFLLMYCSNKMHVSLMTLKYVHL